MGVRSSSSINVVYPTNRVARGGSATFTIDYRAYDVAGIPRPFDPSSIEVIVTRPDGTTITYLYPWSSGMTELEITKAFSGQYHFAVQVNRAGRWKWRVITDGGAGPSEDGYFDVA